MMVSPNWLSIKNPALLDAYNAYKAQRSTWHLWMPILGQPASVELWEIPQGVVQSRLLVIRDATDKSS